MPPHLILEGFLLLIAEAALLLLDWKFLGLLGRKAAERPPSDGPEGDGTAQWGYKEAA